MADNLQYTIGVEVQKAVRELGNFGGAVKNLAPAVEKLRGSLANMDRAANSGGGGLAAMAGGLRAVLGPLAAAAAGYAALHVVTDAFKESINRAADFEQLKVGFTVLLQSGAKAKTMLADLAKFADTTPMQMPELARAARTLLAFGEPAKDVMKDLRQLGDIAAGVQAPIGEIAELFGKARTEGTLFSIDIRELTRRGIPIIGELAKQFHVSENAIHGMAETGRIKFADLQMAIGNLTNRGGMFFGMLAAQGQTFNGMVSTMQDALGALYREFGTPVLEPLKMGVGEITAILAGWKQQATEWGQTLSNVLKGAMAIVQNGDAGAALGAGLKLAFAEAVNFLYRAEMGYVNALAVGMGQAANVLIKALGTPTVWKTIGDMLAAAGHQLISIIQQGIADAVRGIPGMQTTAETMDAEAGNSSLRARQAQKDVGKDLQNADVKDVVKAVAEALQKTGDAYRQGFSGAHNLMDVDVPKSALAGAVNRANERTAPQKPIFYDNETGAPYGPGAPFGSLDSEMPDPAAKAPASSLWDAWSVMTNGAQPAAERNPGPSTIGGRAAASVVGVRPLSLPGPLRPLTLPSIDLNARAQSLVGGAGRQGTDPLLGALVPLVGQILDFMRANKPQPTVAGSAI